MKIKVGEQVTCTLVTGEKAIGYYSCTKPTTGSHLIERVTTENGAKADYAWASSIDWEDFPKGFNPELVRE